MIASNCGPISGDLLRANLATLVPLLLLRRALRRQVREERLQVVQLLRCVLDVASGRHDAHGQLAYTGTSGDKYTATLRDALILRGTSDVNI